MPTDPTNRFSSRVQHYVRSRPDYPRAFYSFLQTDLGLAREWTIADVGSGTGISARPLLEAGNTVYGIEPNAPMRQAAEHRLAAFPHFQSLDATAESTTLPGHTIDLILAAQAFHWFDRTKARAEFVRILKPGGWLVLVWNERRLDASPFLRDYEALVQRYGTDYNTVRHENVDDAAIRSFFAPAEFQTRTFFNEQRFDYAGLESRLLSSSYTPAEDDPRRAPMLADLKSLFDRHQHCGQVAFEYDTRAHYGHLL